MEQRRRLRKTRLPDLRTQRKKRLLFGLVLLLPPPGLKNVATPGLGTEVCGTWLAGRGETYFVTVIVHSVDAEHDYFVCRDGVYLLRRFVFVEFERPRLAGGVVRRSGKAEGVTLKDDRFLLHFVFGQNVSVVHRCNEVPSALESVQVRFGRRRLRLLTVTRYEHEAESADHKQLRFHGDQEWIPVLRNASRKRKRSLLCRKDSVTTSIPNNRSACCLLRLRCIRITLLPC